MSAQGKSGLQVPNVFYSLHQFGCKMFLKRNETGGTYLHFSNRNCRYALMLLFGAKTLNCFHNEYIPDVCMTMHVVECMYYCLCQDIRW
jgi:hypothetical protein